MNRGFNLQCKCKDKSGFATQKIVNDSTVLTTITTIILLFKYKRVNIYRVYNIQITEKVLWRLHAYRVA